MGYFDDFPSLPSLAEVGELMMPSPSMPSMPSDFLPNLPSLPGIAEIGEILPSLPSDFLPNLPSLPGIAEIGEILPGLPSLPGIAEIGEILPSLPSDFLPSLPGISEIGEILPSLPSLPDLPGIAEIGELMMPDLPSLSGIDPATVDPEAMRAAGTRAAERGIARQASGDNVVGQAGDTSIAGEDGPLLPFLFGDNPDMQNFGRLHDVQAAMAEQASGGGAMYTAANVITAGVGGIGSLFGGSETGASAANVVWEAMGYPTGDYANIQGEVANR